MVGQRRRRAAAGRAGVSRCAGFGAAGSAPPRRWRRSRDGARLRRSRRRARGCGSGCDGGAVVSAEGAADNPAKPARPAVPATPAETTPASIAGTANGATWTAGHTSISVWKIAQASAVARTGDMPGICISSELTALAKGTAGMGQPLG
ncbi:hypothetical protein I552_9207 [Mycobacterium xenopi 3993]|nr:hypothetical protein I552_9207 [Mycobacterium xenopi 3993]